MLQVASASALPPRSFERGKLSSSFKMSSGHPSDSKHPAYHRYLPRADAFARPEASQSSYSTIEHPAYKSAQYHHYSEAAPEAAARFTGRVAPAPRPVPPQLPSIRGLFDESRRLSPPRATEGYSYANSPSSSKRTREEEWSHYPYEHATHRPEAYRADDTRRQFYGGPQSYPSPSLSSSTSASFHPRPSPWDEQQQQQQQQQQHHHHHLARSYSSSASSLPTPVAEPSGAVGSYSRAQERMTLGGPSTAASLASPPLRHDPAHETSRPRYAYGRPSDHATASSDDASSTTAPPHDATDVAANLEESINLQRSLRPRLNSREGVPACDECRRRKVKCDRKQPCSRCVGSKRVCETSDTLMRRGPLTRQQKEVFASSGIAYESHRERMKKKRLLNNLAWAQAAGHLSAPRPGSHSPTLGMVASSRDLPGSQHWQDGERYPAGSDMSPPMRSQQYHGREYSNETRRYGDYSDESANRSGSMLPRYADPEPSPSMTHPSVPSGVPRMYYPNVGSSSYASHQGYQEHALASPPAHGLPRPHASPRDHHHEWQPRGLPASLPLGEVPRASKSSLPPPPPHNLNYGPPRYP